VGSGPARAVGGKPVGGVLDDVARATAGDLLRPRVTIAEGLFLVLIASLPVMRPTVFAIGPYLIPPADLIFVPAAAAAAIALVSGRRPMPRSRIVPWLAVYAAALLASTLLSADRGRSALRFVGDLYLLALAGLVIFHVRSLAALRRAMAAWMAGTLITIAAAATGLVLFFAGITDPHRNLALSIKGSLPEGSYPRVMGLFLNPNMFCSYLAVSLAIAITMRCMGWIDRRGALLVSGGIVCAGLSSLSPGIGGIFLVLAFGAWAAWRRTRPRMVRASIVAAWIGAAVFLIAVTASPLPHAALALRSLHPSSRALAWAGAVKAFPAHPWFGKGLGLDVVEILYINPSGIYELLTDAHNSWLSILVQSGIVGLAAFASLVFALVRPSFGVFGSERPEDVAQAGLAVAFGAGFLYQSLTGSFENTRHVWALVGLLAAVTDPSPSVAPAASSRGMTPS
jgi:O-antigen ligase